MQTEEASSIDVRAAQWENEGSLRSGTNAGTDQIAAAAVVLENDVVVVKMKVLNRLLEGKDLQKDLWLTMRYTHAQGPIARCRPQSMLALLVEAKLSRRRPNFIVHGGANAAGHFDCWLHPANLPPPNFVSTLLELWATGSFTVEYSYAEDGKAEGGGQGGRKGGKQGQQRLGLRKRRDSDNDNGAAQMGQVDAEKASKAAAAQTVRLASKAASAAAAAGAIAAAAALALRAAASSTDITPDAGVASLAAAAPAAAPATTTVNAAATEAAPGATPGAAPADAPASNNQAVAQAVTLLKAPDYNVGWSDMPYVLVAFKPFVMKRSDKGKAKATVPEELEGMTQGDWQKEFQSLTENLRSAQETLRKWYVNELGVFERARRAVQNYTYLWVEYQAHLAAHEDLRAHRQAHVQVHATLTVTGTPQEQMTKSLSCRTWCQFFNQMLAVMKNMLEDVEERSLVKLREANS
eukprot:2049642-Pleurochrysis_carterae.AAC.6